jgi:hypothetical protein
MLLRLCHIIIGVTGLITLLQLRFLLRRRLWCDSGTKRDTNLQPVLRIRDILSRILHEKWNANLTVPVLFSYILWFQEPSLSLSHSQKDMGSGKISSRI